MNHFQCHHWSPYLHSWNGHLWPTPIIESDSSLWLWCIWSHQLVVIVGEDFSSKSFNIKVQWWICLEITSIGTLDKMFQTNLSPNLSFKYFFSYFFGKSHHVDIVVSVLVKVTSLIWLWTRVIMCHIWLQMLSYMES